ncbi:membrane-anchored ubiquitin-fold protein 2 [Perilla frutescens var. frutescens]|nr:membrane-anchored ubiquitin-fold protein 2 [Perilla frutescens var. frutescens]
MSGAQEQLEIKFRLIDGSDIGPKSFPAATSVATLKENIIAQWPKEKQNGPRTVKDIKLISGGRVLENNRTVGECRSQLYDIPGGVTTMHVVVQPPAMEKGSYIVDSIYKNVLGDDEFESSFMIECADRVLELGKTSRHVKFLVHRKQMVKNEHSYSYCMCDEFLVSPQTDQHSSIQYRARSGLYECRSGIDVEARIRRGVAAD